MVNDRLDVGGFVGRMAQRMATSNWFPKVGPHVVPPVDRFLNRVTGGRLLLGAVLVPMMVLKVEGRKSGKIRETPLATIPVDDVLYVVGSNYGREHHPVWTLNLMANPEASVDFRGESFDVHAHHLTDEEREAVWPELVEVWPAFDRYREKSGRDLRVFRLERR